MPSFSAQSKKALDTCAEPLQRVLNAVIRDYDFSVIEGHRNQQDQDAAFAAGNSKLRWPNGKHNTLPSRAVDVVPYHPKYGKLVGNVAQIKSIALVSGKTAQWAEGLLREHYCQMAGRILGAATAMGIHLRWGGDWDRDNDLFDNSFDDLPHFEIDA